MKALAILVLSFLLINSCYSMDGAPSAVLSVNSEKKLEFGSVYNFKLTIYPYELDLVKKEEIEKEDFFSFLHVAEVKQIERSENNYDAIEISFLGIITAKYSVERKYNLKISKNIPLILEMPTHGEVPQDLNDFMILGHEKPREKVNYLVYILTIVIVILVAFILWTFKKNKKKTLYEDIVDELSKYTEKKQLEYIYERRKEIMSLNSESKDFFEKLERLQYRKDWGSLDKKELIMEKKKVIEGLNGVR